jgi:hypothetical protein
MVTAIKSSPETDLTAPPGGWKRFVEFNWERQPRYFPVPFPKLLAESSKVFEVLVKTSENARRGLETQPNQKGRVRFYIEHGHITSIAGKYLPTIEDNSFQGYSERILQELNGRDFTLIANNAQAVDFELWNRMRSFLSGLCAIVGTPLRSEFTIYTSKSRLTAAGVHIDTYSNFLFQVIGHKRFLMWPSEILRAKPHLIRSVNYDEIAADAITAEVGPGDLLYIPSEYYHLAETDDELSVHVSFIMNTEKEGWYELAERLACKAAKQRWNGVCPSPFLPPQPASHIDSLKSSGTEQLIGAFKNIGENLEELIVAELNRTVSALGCELSPPARQQETSLSDEDMVESDRNSIISYEIFKQKLFLASNGQGFSCPAHPKLVDLVAELTVSPKQYRVGLLLDQLSSTGIDPTTAVLQREQVRAFLDTLCRIRVIKLVGP